MFMEASYKKISKDIGIIRTKQALHTVVIGGGTFDNGWNKSLACKRFDDENTLFKSHTKGITLIIF